MNDAAGDAPPGRCHSSLKKDSPTTGTDQRGIEQSAACIVETTFRTMDTPRVAFPPKAHGLLRGII